MAKQPEYEIIWSAQPKQAAFISCPADDVAFGGARGGGKSDGVVGDWASHEDLYHEHAIGLALRRERTQLIELIERAKQILVPIGHKWHEQDKYFRGPNGGRLRFAYLENDSDADAYQGHGYTRIYFEEVGTFPSESPVAKLMATLRSGQGVPCQIKSTCNPGGPGHQWVKARYKLDTHPQGMEVFRFEFINPFTKKKIEKTRVFIPSKVVDNKFLGDDYVANLFQVGSENLVKAWLSGDWSVIEGAFFPEWSTEKHVIRPFEIPAGWTRFRSADWGSAKPFSIGWWAVVGDDYSQQESRLPRGALIRYREWYGASAPNVGLKLTAEAVAEGIVSRETNEPKGIDGESAISYGVLDPAAFASDGGPSIAERIAAAGKVFFRRADNARVSARGAMGGWDQLRSRLVGDGDRPMIYFFSTCRDTIRTLPALQHDTAKPEDVDCWIAGTMISTPNGDRAIETLWHGDVVDTPIGPKEVVSAYMSGLSRTIKLETENGMKLDGTPEHKIYVVGKGLISLENIECDDMLMLRNTAWQRKLLNIAVWFTRDMRVAITTIRTALSSRAEAQAFIVRCGSMRADISRQDGTFTTRMKIWTITILRTLNVYHPESICAGMPSPDSQHFRPSSSNGASLKLGGLLYRTTRERCGLALRDANLRADIVGLSSKLDILASGIARAGVLSSVAISRLKSLARSAGFHFGPSAIAPRKSRHVRIIAVGSSDERKRVYNITVADAHLFYANGILSSNTESEDHSPDEIRYACMSRPYIKENKVKTPGKILAVGPGNQVNLNDLWEQPSIRQNQRV